VISSRGIYTRRAATYVRACGWKSRKACSAAPSNGEEWRRKRDPSGWLAGTNVRSMRSMRRCQAQPPATYICASDDSTLGRRLAGNGFSGSIGRGGGRTTDRRVARRSARHRKAGRTARSSSRAHLCAGGGPMPREQTDGPIVRNMQPSIGPDTRSHAAWGCVRRPPEEMCWAPSTSIGAHRVAGPVAPRARAEWVGGASSARALPGKQHADRGRFPSAAVPADGGVVAPLPFPWDAVMGDGGDGGGDGCGDGRGG